MDITYLGHSAFKLRGKNATLVTDPYENSVGLSMPKVSADVVTVSHDHRDHNAIQKVTGTARREQPYVITKPGEYEVAEIGIFGWGSYHDDKQGAERGKNTIFVIMIDGVRIAHLGDLGHTLPDDLIDDIGDIDVLLVPVGGVYTLAAEQAVTVVQQLQPPYVVPMHYKTDKHDTKTFGELTGVETFLKAMGVENAEYDDKLTLTGAVVAEDTSVVVLTT
jgi:L-ascorbate metabolism protein UlaG (beta-lactamase superfamily)